MADGLVAALARCQLAFPAIVKSHINPAFKGSQYADVADVLAAVRPVLAAEGIVVSQYTQIDDSGGVTLITSLLYGPDGLDVGISSSFPLQTHGLNAQGVGSLMTYHRRYQLCAILGVHPVGDDDDGNLAATAQTVVTSKTELSHGYPIVKPPTGWETEPLAKFTFAELRAIADHLKHPFSGGSKSELIRQLEPLVRAASGEPDFMALEPSQDAPAAKEPETVPFSPVIASAGSVRKGTNSAMGAD